MFAVEPKSHIIPLEIDIEHTTLPHNIYKIYNIGYVDICVELLYGTSNNWETVAEENIVKPGQTVIFDNVGKLFELSGIKISNKTDLRAIVHCTPIEYLSPVVVREPNVFDRDYGKNLRDTYSVGVKYVPYISKKYRGLYNAFWFSDKLNVWEEILFKLQPLLKEGILQAVSVSVNGFMGNIQQKLDTLSIAYDEELPTLEIYLEIARDLSEFGKKLIPQEYDAKYLLLPLFSNFVMLKTAFYALGVITASDIGLSPANLSYIENLLNASKDATKYINNMFNDYLNYAYNTSHLEDLYNSMINVRSYISIHGMEFTRIWDYMVRSPFTGDKVFNDVISYSNFFGRQTPNLVREATSEKMYPPLTPRYIGFIYNYLTSIEVYLWMGKIGGMKLVFADHSSYIMGTKTEVMEQLDFMGSHITKLQVTGTGVVDSCTFHMSDGRELVFGTKETNSAEEVFELKDHRIVSLFLSNDDDSLGGQAANIAVSYRLNCVYE